MVDILERLATESCEEFLQAYGLKGELKSISTRIRLYGTTKDVLRKVREKMMIYFRQKKKKVKILFGEKGYAINVGYYLSKQKDQ